RGGSVVVCGNRSGVFSGIVVAQNRGFITLLEAEHAWRRVRASDTLDGFDQAGLVFVAEGQNPFRLAAAVRPRAGVCVLRSTGGDRSFPAESASGFPFLRRLIRVSYYDRNRLAVFPDPTTDPELPATLTAWLKPFGLSTIVFPAAAHLLPRAA